jgi:N-acetyltransferase
MSFDLSQHLVLENESAKLIPLQESDYHQLLPIALGDLSLLQYSPSGINSEENLRAYIQSAIMARDNKTRYPFIIYDKRSQKFAGSTSYGNISNEDKRLEIGWTWIDKKFQGTGLNKAIKYLMLAYAFEVLEFERVEFRIDSRNKQSRRAVEKIGGILEGELRSHTVMMDGYRRNTVMYSILKGEWRSLKQTIFSSLK